MTRNAHFLGSAAAASPLFSLSGHPHSCERGAAYINSDKHTKTTHIVLCYIENGGKIDEPRLVALVLVHSFILVKFESSWCEDDIIGLLLRCPLFDPPSSNSRARAILLLNPRFNVFVETLMNATRRGQHEKRGNESLLIEHLLTKTEEGFLSHLFFCAYTACGWSKPVGIPGENP